jgi:fatty acid desaturase
MAMTHSEWYRGLDPQKKQAIRELHTINLYWNLVGFLFIALWVVAGITIGYAPTWYLRIPGYILIGLLIHGMSNLMHEGIHGTLFKHRRWDRWYGFLMGAPSMFSLTAYGVNHLLHHKHTRSEQDPDEFNNLTHSPRLLSVFYYVWIIFGMLIYSVRVPWVALKHGSASDHRKMVVERTLLTAGGGSVLALAWWFGSFGTVVHVWLIPLGIASFLGNVRGWAEHTLTLPNHPLVETRTVTSNRLFSFLNINLNYHLEHHLFPGIPWYNLPKVHRVLLDDYKAAGSSIYRSYTRFLFDAFRTGIHGLAPREIGNGSVADREPMPHASSHNIAPLTGFANTNTARAQ